MPNDKPLKCRLIRDNRETPLAWNVSDYEFSEDTGFLLLKHERGEVIHKFAPGDTIVMLEQFGGSNHEND